MGWINLEGLRPDMVPEVLSNGLSGWLDGWKVQPIQGMTWQPPPLSAPWARPGWYAQAETWINAEVAKLGENVRGIEPLKCWCISAVLRVQTTSRPVFFKASLELPLFVNEGVVMAGLAQLYPDYIPAPLAVNAARNWMLSEDLGEPIGRDAPYEQKEGLFQAIARMQIDSSQRLDNLLRIGCIDRCIPWLQAHLDALLADEITLSMITPAEREELRRALPRLQQLLTELDSLPIPPALLHGDLHTGNVALRDGRSQIFDWTDAAITHPFFDLDVVFTTEDPGLRVELGDAYLSVWEQVYPSGVVRRAFDLARVVYGLYHAVSYQYILNNLDVADREEINSAHYFFRQVLAGLANLD
jgi:fructosamine-3-kinase